MTTVSFVPVPSPDETRIDQRLVRLLTDRYGAGVTLQLSGVKLGARTIDWLDGIIAVTSDSVIASEAIELRDAIRKHGAVRLMVNQ